MAAHNKKQRMSYFAETRQTQVNPNYFSTADPNVLQRNVKRILKDIANGNIIPEDYVYFKNDNLLTVCMNESYKEMMRNWVLSRALTFYKMDVLQKNMQMYFVNTVIEYTIAGVELQQATGRASAWNCAFACFKQISQGSDPMMTLAPLAQFVRIINDIS